MSFPAPAAFLVDALTSVTVTVWATTLYCVGSVQVIAKADAAFVTVAAMVPFAEEAVGDAWQLDTTVADTENEAVAVAALADIDTGPAPSRPSANATGNALMSSFLAHNALRVNCFYPRHRQPEQSSRNNFICHIGRCSPAHKLHWQYLTKPN